MGQLLGKEKLFSYLDLFGFGEKTGIDLNGEGKGIIFNLDQVGNVEKETGNVIQKTDPKVVRKTISKKTSKIMRRALESVVAKGGGKAAFIEGYRIGGKTGTAQKVQDGKYLVNNYIMSFVGIVPSNNPEAVLYIAIDNPKNTAQLSSYTTTPVARRILLDIISALGIKKQEGEMEKDLEWTDKISCKVPNVVGLDVKTAKKNLENFTIEYSGVGDKVKSQSPEPGERLEEGGTIRLLLS